jgi:tetratricopeptide (TPR) repeat protein
VTAIKADRKKARRKEKLKEKRQRSVRSGQIEKAEFFFLEALRSEEQGNPEKALHQMEKAVQRDPKDEEYLFELGRLGHTAGRQDIEFKVLLRLQEMEALDLQGTLSLCSLLTSARQYTQALNLIDATLRFLPRIRVKNKKTLLRSFEHQKLYCEAMIAKEKKPVKSQPRVEEPAVRHTPAEKEVLPKAVISSPPPEIQIHVEVDPSPPRACRDRGDMGITGGLRTCPRRVSNPVQRGF